jgi:glucose dehydrogenase
LLSFNVGVEFGQLAVIGAVMTAVGVWFGCKGWYQRRVVTPASMATALTGSYWTVRRIAV